MSESSILINSSRGQWMHAACATAHAKIAGHLWHLTDGIYDAKGLTRASPLITVYIN